MKKILYILTFLLIFSTSYSQREYHNWVFGHGSYITFNTDDGNPIFVDSLSVSVPENTSVISDNSGQLQYYSFENYIYNSGDEIISNAVDGHASSMQGSCMLRINDDHYIRVGSNYSRDNTPENTMLTYVDIIKNGNSESISERKVLDSSFTSEGLLVIKTKLEGNIYLVVSDTSGTAGGTLSLYKYENDQFKQKQTLTYEHNYPFHFIKYSPFNKLIVGTNLDTNQMHFFRFNQTNEQIEDVKRNSIIQSNNNASYVEFSPNGEYLYVASSFDFYRLEGLNQIDTKDITINNLNYVQSTGDLGQMLLGPNNKIYISRNGMNYLVSLENPNSKSDILFNPQAVDLENTRSIIGLPNIPTSYYYTDETRDTINVCVGDSLILEPDTEFEDENLSYKWEGPNNYESEDSKSKIHIVGLEQSGSYKLVVLNSDSKVIYSHNIHVIVNEGLVASIKGNNICEGETTTLEALPNDPSYSYKWSNGATTPVIEIDEPNTYSVEISKGECSGIDEYTVIEYPLPEFVINGKNLVCEKPVKLSPDKDFAKYLWSTDEVTKEIEVTEPGTYSLTVTDSNGCETTESINIELDSISFAIIGEDIVCGNSATLTPDKDFSEYLWSTDEITKEIEVNEPGTYTLTVTDENGCQATKEFNVNEQSLSFDISKDRIDFGKVYISETAIDSVTIINRSGIELTITDGTQNYIIPDGFPVEYTKTLEPTELGPYTDSFEYRVIEPCDTVITIPVTAEVYARIEISTKDIDTEIGKEETIPVYLECESDLGEQTYTITTDIDKTVLFTDDDYTFTQTAPINKVKTKVYEISGMVMLASELEYDITFPSYEFNNPYIEVNTNQGKIKIDSVCAFPQRSITFTESTEMKVSPNPARDRLVVDISTDVSATLNVPEMTLELISSEGRVAYTEYWTQTRSEKQISINTGKIPSGLYQVRLQTPSGVLTENVIVVR